MILMGENTFLEDCTIQLSSLVPCDLTGILFYGSSTFTSKLKGCHLYVNNFNVTSTPTNVIGVLANGTGIVNTFLEVFEAVNTGTSACIENSTIQIFSNYKGSKRGIVVGGGSATTANILTIKNTNIFIQNPSISPGGGSWCAVENNSAYSKVRTFTSIISGPTTASYDDYSDIAQTSGEIVIGEGTTLVNKRSRLKTTNSWLPFKVLTNTKTLFYAALGNINNFTTRIGNANITGYLLPGTMMIQDYTYTPPSSLTSYDFQYPIPTPNVQSAFYTIAEKSILMSAKVRLGKAQSTTTASPMVNQIYVTVYYDKVTNPVTSPTGANPAPEQLFLITLNDTVTEQTYNSSSGVFVLEEGGQLRVSMSYTGGTGNAAKDLYVQLELY